VDRMMLDGSVMGAMSVLEDAMPFEAGRCGLG
jgi:hypothetical protein